MHQRVGCNSKAYCAKQHQADYGESLIRPVLGGFIPVFSQRCAERRGVIYFCTDTIIYTPSFAIFALKQIFI